MSSLAQLLKSEIERLARKEVRQQLRKDAHALKKATSQHRSAIAALKRQTQALERAMRELRRLHNVHKSPALKEEATAQGVPLRFRAAGMATNRKRLGLSGAAFGALVGVSAKSIFDWEQGKSKPKPHNLRAIAALRGISIEDARRRLRESPLNENRRTADAAQPARRRSSKSTTALKRASSSVGRG